MSKPVFPALPPALVAMLIAAAMAAAGDSAIAGIRSAGTLESRPYEIAGDPPRAEGGKATDTRKPPAPASHLWLVALEFANADDAGAVAALAARMDALPPPDAGSAARAFIREHLGIESDDHVVAHFASAEDRRDGKPDRTTSLTDALVEAFPDHARHSFFAGSSDLVGGILGGGAGSPAIVKLGEQLAHAGDAKTVFGNIGSFLWSRTGPGYLYNAFFAKGNIVETVGEDARALDEAFGVYRTGGFDREHESALTLSRLVDAFKAPGAFAELPYVKSLDADLDEYWQRNKADWPVLARYQFVLRARLARESGLLSRAQYERVMRAGAPHVPLDGPVSMAQLRETAQGSGVAVRRFDINGYTATNLVRFIADDGGEVMYIPGRTPSFVVADNEQALRQWVLEQARDPQALESLLSHFSLHDAQDGVFWTGVRHGLEKLGSGRWRADGDAVDHANATIDGDIFEDMRATTERRMRSDAGMLASTAWEAWRATINRTATLLSPVGFVRPLVVPVQVLLGVVQTATGVEQGLDGRTLEERKRGLEQAGMTIVTNVALAGLLGRQAQGGLEGDQVSPMRRQPFFVPPKRINGRVGYLMSPTRAPGIPRNADARLYIDQGGELARWSDADLSAQTLAEIPRGMAATPSGIFMRGSEAAVIMRGQRAARIRRDGTGYRLALRDGTPGPRVVRHADGYWDLALTDDNYFQGSVVAQRVDVSYTTHPEVLHRAAEILEQLGSSEASLLASHQAGMGPLLKVSVGQAIIETLPGRLRDPGVNDWSPREVALLAPEMARAMHHPLALYGEDGQFQFAVRADGTESAATGLPSNTLRLRRDGDLYVDMEYEGMHMPRQRRTIFQLVGSRVGYGFKASETYFRQELALYFDARSTTPELDLVERWIDPLELPVEERQMLLDLSRLRHAVFDRYTKLLPRELDRLEWADQARHSASSPGQPYLRTAFDDLMARVADEETDLLPADIDYLTDLLRRVAEGYDALLPEALDSLVVADESILLEAALQNADHWISGGRHYVRLRHFDGRTQVVETTPYIPEVPYRVGQRSEILAPGMGSQRGTGRHVLEAYGMWFFEKDMPPTIVCL